MTCLASSISKLRKTSLWLFKTTLDRISLLPSKMSLMSYLLISVESVFKRKLTSTIHSLAREFPLIIRIVKTQNKEWLLRLVIKTIRLSLNPPRICFHRIAYNRRRPPQLKFRKLPASDVSNGEASSPLRTRWNTLRQIKIQVISSSSKKSLMTKKNSFRISDFSKFKIFGYLLQYPSPKKSLFFKFWKEVQKVHLTSRFSES